MGKDKYNQPLMFPEGADLPLFSGMAQEGEVEVFEPELALQPERLFKCPICMDTGRVIIKTGRRFSRKYYPCWCETGRKAKCQEGQKAHFP